MRLLRLLLLAWPRDFRDRHGPQLLAFWESQRAEARYRGSWGRVRFLAEVLGDAITGGLRARLRTTRTNGMRESMMRTMWMDLRYARRALAGAPMFTVVAAVTLALGIAATTLVFSAVNGVVLRPLPFPDADRLVQVIRTDNPDQTPNIGWPDFADWREQAQGFQGLAAYTERDGTFGWTEGAEQLYGAYVTHDFFEVMGVEMAQGRSFTAAEDVSGGPPVMIVSDAFWRSRMGSDPEAVGSSLPLDGESWTVVGIAPRDFAAPLDPTWFWTPLREDDILASVGLPTGTRTLYFLDVVGRLAAGAEMTSVQGEVRELAQRIDAAVGKDPERYSNVTLIPMAEYLLGDVDRTLFFLLVAAALVLLVATANVAGLAISRTATRTRELAVRTALGAGRARLTRQLFTEAGVLSGFAGLGGVLLAWTLLAPLRRMVPPDFPRAEGIALDGPTLLFAAGATALSGLIFGALPAFLATRGTPSRGLATGSRGASAGRKALLPQQLLATLQVATSVVLLTGGVLLVTSFSRLLDVDRGFDAESVVVATVAPPESRYQEPSDIDAFYGQLLDALRARPEVTHASTTYSPPLFGTYFYTTVLPEGVEEEPTWAGTVVIRDGYFETSGIPLLRGRDFSRMDVLGEPPVVIVNQSLAERFWPGEDPIGKRIHFTGGLRGSADSFERSYFPREGMTVVGLAADARRETLARPAEPEYYRPHGQLPWGYQFLVVRSTLDPERLAGAIREAVWALDASVPVREVTTMETQVAVSVATRRFQMLLLVSFAVMASVLAMVGLYAVMALTVTRRIREMGIRLALGARPGEVASGVLTGGLRMVFWGTALGLAVSYATADTMSSMLFGVEPNAPSVYVVVVALTTGVAALACWFPARRAARVDPVLSLQEE